MDDQTQRVDMDVLTDLLAGGLRASEHLGEPDGAQFRAALASIVFDLGRRPAIFVLKDLVAAARANEGSWLWLLGRSEDIGLDPVGIWAATSAPILYYGPPVSSLAPHPNDYRLVPVDDLPAWHNPHLCSHRATWDDLVGQQRAREDRVSRRLRQRIRRLLGSSPATAQQRARAAARAPFEDLMRSGQLGPCGRHGLGGDIRAANADAWRNLTEFRAGSRRWSHHEVSRAVTGRDVPGELSAQQRLTAALLQDPVTWSPGADQVASGQHRICQARAAGLAALVVRVK